jgi:hypothetical protein
MAFTADSHFFRFIPFSSRSLAARSLYSGVWSFANFRKALMKTGPDPSMFLIALSASGPRVEQSCAKLKYLCRSWG